MEKDRNTIIGERVRYYRTTQKLSLKDAADQVERKITPQMLSLYEKGKSSWPADLICELAKVLRIDPRLLLGMESGRHERKDSPEWEAEKYKNSLLGLKHKSRAVVYKIIDGMVELGF